MKNKLITKLFISFSAIFAILPTNYTIAGSHELEISLQNCDYAKAFAKTVIKKKVLELWIIMMKLTSPVQ